MSNKVIVKVGSLRGKLINCPKRVEYRINKACSYYAENYHLVTLESLPLHSVTLRLQLQIV